MYSKAKWSFYFLTSIVDITLIFSFAKWYSSCHCFSFNNSVSSAKCAVFSLSCYETNTNLLGPLQLIYNNKNITRALTFNCSSLLISRSSSIWRCWSATKLLSLNTSELFSRPVVSEFCEAFYKKAMTIIFILKRSIKLTTWII